MINLDYWKIFIETIKVAFIFLPYFAILLGIIVGFKLLENWLFKILNKNRLKKYKNWGSEQNIIIKLKSLSPKEFEEFISYLFSKLGYETKTTGGTNDGGIDVIAKKNGKTNYIQCKKYISSQVTVGALRDFYGAIANKLTDSKGYFITTNKFTLEAEKFAEDKPIELIDNFKLLKYIKLAKILKEEIPESDNICPKCGGSLILRTSKYGEFFGCSNYPNCKYIKQITESK